MESLRKLWAFRVVLALLLALLFPIIAANIALALGELQGNRFAGRILLALIEYPDGPASIIQKLLIPILGLVSLPVLWREKGRYAAVLIICCLIGMALTLILWVHLSDPANAADLWQESNTGLNGRTFGPAMHAYMKSVMIVLGVDLLMVFGLKALEWLKGVS